MKTLVLLITLVSLFGVSHTPIENNNARRQISGQVLDNYGEPLPGAVITIGETGETIVADMEGRFTAYLSRDKKCSIKVSTIGHLPAEITSDHFRGLFTEITLKGL